MISIVKKATTSKGTINCRKIKKWYKENIITLHWMVQ